MIAIGRLLVAAMVSSVASILAPNLAFACDCPGMSEEFRTDIFKGADFIGRGRVVDVRKALVRSILADDPHRIVIEPQEVLKGERRKRIVFYTSGGENGANCGTSTRLKAAFKRRTLTDVVLSKELTQHKKIIYWQSSCGLMYFSKPTDRVN